jgi:hypothetical protein
MNLFIQVNIYGITKMKMAEQDVAPCEDQRLGIGQSIVNIS